MILNTGDIAVNVKLTINSFPWQYFPQQFPNISLEAVKFADISSFSRFLDKWSPCVANQQRQKTEEHEIKMIITSVEQLNM